MALAIKMCCYLSFSFSKARHKRKVAKVWHREIDQWKSYYKYVVCVSLELCGVHGARKRLFLSGQMCARSRTTDRMRKTIHLNCFCCNLLTCAHVGKLFSINKIRCLWFNCFSFLLLLFSRFSGFFLFCTHSRICFDFRFFFFDLMFLFWNENNYKRTDTMIYIVALQSAKTHQLRVKQQQQKLPPNVRQIQRISAIRLQ